MAGELSLKTPATGLVTLSPANTATDKTITLPATTGTVVIQDGTNTTTVNNLAYTGTLTGGTGVINIGSGQVYKDASGNVGIGTSSPGAKLQVQSGTLSNPTWAASDVVIAGNSTGNAAYYHALSDVAGGFIFSTPTTRARSFLLWSEGSGNMLLTNGSSGSIIFSNNGSERARIDSSGNLGLGVTPSAWNSANPAIQFTGEVSISRFGFGRNAYYDGTNYRYITTNVATLYQQSSGNHTWNVAPSGTAGNAISFTQAMTLTAAGDLGVGATSPAQKLHVIGSAIIQDRLLLQRSSGSLNLAIASFWDGAGSPLSGTKGDLLAIGNSGGSDLVFVQNNTERARIDSSGNLLVGTQSVAGTGGLTINPNGTDGATAVIWNRTSRTGTSFPIDFRNGGTTSGYIAYNNTSTSYVTSSDYRLKENVAPMTGALAKVQQLKPCTYTWKADGSAGQGFIAHELQAVVPDAVTGEKDAIDAEGNPQYQGVDTSFLVATLTAAIQELTARLEVLENK